MATVVKITKTDSLAKLTKKLTKNFTVSKPTLNVGFIKPDTAYIAAIQEYGATIVVTEKMRKYLMYRIMEVVPDKKEQSKWIAKLPKIGSSINIPARPFMQQTVDANEDTWTKLIKQQLPKLDYDIIAVFKQLGLQIIADMVDIIAKADFEPNSPLTLLLKGAKPVLIDSGNMQKSIEMEIIK